MKSAAAAALEAKLGIEDLEVAGRRVLVRADLNLPVQDGRVSDDTRLLAALPTLRALLDAGAAVVVMAHRGRPKGVANPEFSMAPVAAALRAALQQDVGLQPDCVGAQVEAATRALPAGAVMLLENLRFHAGEAANDAAFAAALAALGDLYVDDAFGAAHRAHASIVGVPDHLPQAAAGKLLRLEVEMLSRCLQSPPPPFVLVAGGAKVADKLDAVANLMPLVDRLIIGGAMANSVLAATGVEVGRSRLEAGSRRLAEALLAGAAANDVEVLLPTDFVVAPDLDGLAAARTVTRIPADCMALDIGPASAKRFAEAIADARTVLWNGPMGVFEIDALAAGTRAVGAAIAGVHGRGGFSVAGGGDTAAAAAKFGYSASISHVSTGGGASLDLLSGRVLPGIAALTDRSV